MEEDLGVTLVEARLSPVLPVNVNFKQSNVIIPAKKQRHRQIPSSNATPQAKKLLKKLVATKKPSDTYDLLRSLEGSPIGSFRKDSDRAAYLIERDPISPQRRYENSIGDNWKKLNLMRAISPNDKCIAVKDTYLRRAYSNLDPVLRPPPKKIKRQGEKAVYIGGKHRYHPHLELVMAAQVVSPYNYDRNDKIFVESKTGWFGYTPKRLDLIHSVKDAKRVSKSPLYEKKKKRKELLPDFYKKANSTKKTLADKFRTICNYNSPFYHKYNNVTAFQTEFEGKKLDNNDIEITMSDSFFKAVDIIPEHTAGLHRSFEFSDDCVIHSSLLEPPEENTINNNLIDHVTVSNPFVGLNDLSISCRKSFDDDKKLVLEAEITEQPLMNTPEKAVNYKEHDFVDNTKFCSFSDKVLSSCLVELLSFHNVLDKVKYDKNRPLSSSAVGSGCVTASPSLKKTMGQRRHQERSIKGKAHQQNHQ